MKSQLIKRFLQPNVIVGASVILSLTAIAVAFYLTGQKPSDTYSTVMRGSIIEEVDTPGVVQAAEAVDLSFEASGRIATVSGTVGSHVLRGQIIASLANEDANAAYEQARAALHVQQAKLNGLREGTRPEDIAVSVTAVAGAKASLAQAQQSLMQAAEDAYVKSDDGIRNKLDQFVSNGRTTPTLLFFTSDSQLQVSVLSGRLSMESLLNAWQSQVAAASPDGHVDSSMLSQTARANLIHVGSYLDQVADMLTKAIPSTTYPLSTIQGYETNITVARSNISMALAALNVADTQEKAAESALASAQSQLDLKRSGSTATDMQAQEAQVAAAQANVDAAAAQISKGIIHSPLDGTISRDDAHVGATAAPGLPLISVISDAKFQMLLFISQADLGKLNVGQSAKIYLAAYANGNLFPAHVLAIDPAASTQNGVAAYKVTLQFDAEDARIQAGLSGNTHIATAQKDAALKVPQSAVITRGADTFVLRADNAGGTLTKVVTGIFGADGMVEILSGLSEGDHIRSFGQY